ncbi:4Fe-4S binding protein [Proteinivorax hydrogeniformans]|uniref:4Fe-4S binding protein n=1 Tax=Proteinivorax hydrogeniformans TaxID=1826727 RepID=A0AAU8HV59_9FIRM
MKFNKRVISQITGIIFTVFLISLGIYNFNFILVAMGTLVAIFYGRFFCGWFCPMGTFAERVLSKISKNRKPPKFMQQKWFPYVFLVIFLSYLAVLMFSGVPYGVLIMMGTVALTSIVLAALYRPRTWCEFFCPWGTIMSLVSFKSGKKISIDDRCKGCKLCVKSCNIPNQLSKSIDERKKSDGGTVELSDRCIKCTECITACPHNAIGFDKK